MTEPPQASSVPRPHDPGSGSKHISEDEAALYDRQIRLWGVEAQNRMKSASVLLINFRGLGAETAKNLVLAGINRLGILDCHNVTEEDLGSNFFLREDDLAKPRVEAGKTHVQTLNPHVQIDTYTDDSFLKNSDFLDTFDLICLTDSHRNQIMEINRYARYLGKRFHASGSLGIHGYIFSDQGHHEYVVEKEQAVTSSSSSTTAVGQVEKKRINIFKTQPFVPFDDTFLQYDFVSKFPKRQQRRLNPISLAVFILWEFQNLHNGDLPHDSKYATELEQIANSILPQLGRGSNLTFETSPLTSSMIMELAETSFAEFTPTCTQVGGILSQDILNVLGGREESLANLFVFNGQSNSGDIYAVGNISQ